MAKLEYIDILDIVVGDILVSHNDYMLVQNIFFVQQTIHIKYFSLSNSKYKYPMRWNIFGAHKVNVIKKNEYRRFTFSD